MVGKHAIAVNSGTASLEIMLRIADVRGKDVLVPANTFIATAAAVIAAGGNPILMDTDPATLSTTVAEVAKRVTPKTVGTMLVHIAGVVTDQTPAIAELMKSKGLWLMEDAAHAHILVRTPLEAIVVVIRRGCAERASRRIGPGSRVQHERLIRIEAVAVQILQEQRDTGNAVGERTCGGRGGRGPDKG